MAYVKIKNGKVVQKQPYEGKGFVEVSDDISCGMLYKDGEFISPAPVDNMTYAQKRAKEYPPIGDQLDALWKEIHEMKPKTKEAKEMLAKIKEVKTKHPKG